MYVQYIGGIQYKRVILNTAEGVQHSGGLHDVWREYPDHNEGCSVQWGIPLFMYIWSIS